MIWLLKTIAATTIVLVVFFYLLLLLLSNASCEKTRTSVGPCHIDEPFNQNNMASNDSSH
jgi:preprotein translocase subunit SecG